MLHISFLQIHHFSKFTPWFSASVFLRIRLEYSSIALSIRVDKSLSLKPVPCIFRVLKISIMSPCGSTKSIFQSPNIHSISHSAPPTASMILAIQTFLWTASGWIPLARSTSQISVIPFLDIKPLDYSWCSYNAPFSPAAGTSPYSNDTDSKPLILLSSKFRALPFRYLIILTTRLFNSTLLSVKSLLSNYSQVAIPYVRILPESMISFRRSSFCSQFYSCSRL